MLYSIMCFKKMKIISTRYQATIRVAIVLNTKNKRKFLKCHSEVKNKVKVKVAQS